MKIMVTEAGKRAYSWGSVLKRRAEWPSADMNTKMWATLWAAHHMEMDNVEFSGVEDISKEEGAMGLAGLMNLYISNSNIQVKPAGILINEKSVMLCRREELIRCVLTREDVMRPKPLQEEERLVCQSCGGDVYAEYKVEGEERLYFHEDGSTEKTEYEFEEHHYMGLHCKNNYTHETGLMLNEDSELIHEPIPVYFVRLSDAGQDVMELLELFEANNGNTELGSQVLKILKTAKTRTQIPWLNEQVADPLTAHKALLHVWRITAPDGPIPSDVTIHPFPWDLNTTKRALQAKWVEFLPVAH